MQLENIYHRSAFSDCYAVNTEEIIIRIRTGKDVTGVNVIHGDPYSAGISASHPWSGEIPPMSVCHLPGQKIPYGIRLCQTVLEEEIIVKSENL